MTTIYEAVQALCLGSPEAEEVVSHGYPSFRIRGKTFATYSVNHHGDGKVALLLNLSRDIQAVLVESAPRHFFVPPYSGPKGWVGVELDQGIQWHRVASLAWDAFSRVAPATLKSDSPPPPPPAPTKKMKPEDIDPYLSAGNQKIIERLRGICLPLPEVSEDRQFGNPCFKAGRKTFCNLHRWQGRTELQVWVGAEQQSALTSFDERYRVPQYIGHNGWISFDLTGRTAWQEVRALVEESYRHFALRRMLKVLDG